MSSYLTVTKLMSSYLTVTKLMSSYLTVTKLMSSYLMCNEIYVPGMSPLLETHEAHVVLLDCNETHVLGAVLSAVRDNF